MFPQEFIKSVPLLYVKILAKKRGLCYTESMEILRGLKNKRVCVGLSGGVDSASLLHYLFSFRESYGYELSAVHCEHGIRGEASLEDMRFVQSLCQRLQIPLFCFQEDCSALAKNKKMSLETAARSFRYECFQSLVDSGKVDYIATAHHLDDEAETVLFRLARGSSLTGASGMREKNGWLIRPFLSWTRKEIESYASENGVAYRVDETNFETDATRNKIRLQVLPALENAVSGASGNLARFATLAAEDDAFLYNLAEALIAQTEKGWLVQCNPNPSLFRRACLIVMKRLGIDKDYTSEHLESAFALQDKQGGARVHLPKCVIAEKTRSGIAFFLADSEEEIVIKTEAQPFSLDGFDGGVYEVKLTFDEMKAVTGVEKVLRVDMDKIPKTAVFRFRRERDEIVKFGGGRRTLKRFFNDKKIPLAMRGVLPIIAEQDGKEVYAVCGVEIADGVKVTEDTQRVLYIILQKKD